MAFYTLRCRAQGFRVKAFGVVRLGFQVSQARVWDYGFWSGIIGAKGLQSRVTWLPDVSLGEFGSSPLTGTDLKGVLLRASY